MNKLTNITKAEKDSPLLWRIFINGKENLASSFEVSGYMYDILSEENGVTKYNVGCKGKVRWEGSKAIVVAARKPADICL
jgi:hypothetical protein